MSWRDRAGCQGYDWEWWFAAQRGGIGEGPTIAPEGQIALEICNTACEVRDECLEWALTHPGQSQEGIWGGLTASQRYTARKHRRRNKKTGSV